MFDRRQPAKRFVGPALVMQRRRAALETGRTNPAENTGAPDEADGLAVVVHAMPGADRRSGRGNGGNGLPQPCDPNRVRLRRA